ncbi:MAG: MATE family efflux transporter [Ruminococcaceae bacterium]|nr:MATE family efflux transporter [Oscillospiraceae bacterium]
MSRKTFSIVDESANPWKIIILLAWPIFLEQILVSLVQAVDTAMVGSLGANATASVAISQSPNMMINGVIMAMGVGFTSLVARSVGAGDTERAKSLIRQAILLVIAIGLPLAVLCFCLARHIPMWMGGAEDILDTAATYNRIFACGMLFRGMTMVLTAIYRGFGDSKTPMKINIAVNLMNVVGNFLMIYPTRQLSVFGVEFTMFGFGWGVAGAATATALSTIIGSLALLGVTFFRKSELQLSFKDDFRPNWKEISSVFKISFPAMCERFVMSGASVIVASTVASLGTVAVASQNLAGTAESLSFMPGFAFGTAATTLFGQSIGAKRPELGKKYVSYTIRLGAAVMFVMTLVMFFGSRFIMSIFTPDEAVIEMGSVLVKILALIQVPQMIAMVYSGALKGAGDTKSPFLVALFSMWGVRVLGVTICVRLLGMGMTALCTCMCTDNVVRFILFSTIYRREKWRKHIEA